jgi:potassium/hydrogen antiporter
MIGAALAPTDPAILIPLFDRLRLRPRVAQMIVAESALNDPTGAVLALAFAGAVATGTTDAADPVLEFVLDVGLSTAIGVGFGLLLAIAVSTSRAGLWRESASLAAAAVVAGSFISIDFAGGSGYLGAFLAGLIVGNLDQIGLALHGEHERELRTAIAAVSEVVVLLVFLGLGVSLPFAAIGDHLPAALLVVAGLVLVARPLTVAACLLADRRARWTREELLFLAWTRETGVVPAALAGLLIAREVPHAELVEVTVAVALVVTLVVQTATKPALARRLGLLESDRPTG